MSKKGAYRRFFIVAGLLIFFLFQSASIALKKSNTWDESAHILAGYAQLKEGMDYLSPLNHPAFGRALTGLFPALLLDLDFDETVSPEGAQDSSFFRYSLKFMYENRIKGDRVLFLARLANILLGLMLGVYVFLWSESFWGKKGGYFSLFLYALSPNILAHSSLATTDMPVTALFFISVYYIYGLSTEGASFKRVLPAAIFIALALTSKHTALLLAPILALSFAINLRKSLSLKTVSYCALLLAAIYILIWAIYGFRYHSGSPNYTPLDWHRFSQSSLSPLFDILRNSRFLPEAYLYGLAGSVMGASTGKAAFLMGEYSSTGWWYYFIAAFLIKTPVPTLIFLSAVFIYGVAGGQARTKSAILIIPALLIFAAMSFQRVNIGLRHVLPAYPFIFALAGFIPSIRTESIRLARYAFYVLSAWYLYAAASIFPHDLAYFNEFIGGPENGYKYLVDSNLDWGQDLKGLKHYMERNNIGRIKLAYFGLSDPAYFNIDYEYLPGYVILEPRNAMAVIELKGWFAISATMLQGVYLPDKDLYAVFRDLEPVDTIGYSIFIYRL